MCCISLETTLWPCWESHHGPVLRWLRSIPRRSLSAKSRAVGDRSYRHWFASCSASLPGGIRYRSIGIPRIAWQVRGIWLPQPIFCDFSTVFFLPSEVAASQAVLSTHSHIRVKYWKSTTKIFTNRRKIDNSVYFTPSASSFYISIQVVLSLALSLKKNYSKYSATESVNILRLYHWPTWLAKSQMTLNSLARKVCDFQRPHHTSLGQKFFN